MNIKRKAATIMSSTLVLLSMSSVSFADIVIDNPDYYNNYGYNLETKITRNNTYSDNNLEDTNTKLTPKAPITNQKPKSSKSSINLREYTYNYGNSYIIPRSSTKQIPVDNSSSIETETNISQDQKNLLNLINNERKKAGLSPLKLNTKLCEIAQKKSQDMHDNNYFSHYSPIFGKTSNLINKKGISYRYFGENIARTYSVYRAHNGFMNSDGHKANILNKNFNEIGIGIVGNYYTEVFIGK